MGEHTPCPTPARGIYGYALFLSACIGLFVYFVWALIPDYYLESIGLTYWPNKYWAIALPIFVFSSLIFFELFICAYNLANCCDVVDEVRVVVDDFGTADDYFNN